MTFRRHDGADGPLHNVLKRRLYETYSRKPRSSHQRPSATAAKTIGADKGERSTAANFEV
jgi:hypothetical protein